MTKTMNATDQYTVNRSNAEFPMWEAAHWERASEVAGFHIMRLDYDGLLVVKHISAIKPVKTATKPLEDEMCRLLEHAGLVPEARKLIAAALQAQASGKTEFSI